MLFQSIMDFLSNPFLFAALSASLTLLLVQLLLRKLNNKSNNMKKKKYHPVAGTVFNQMMNFNRLHHYMTDLARKYRTYRLLNPFRSEVYTSEPSNVEYILKTNFENYGKGLYNYQNLKDLLGDGIFAVDGEKWREQRKISSHEFSTKMLRDFSTSIFRKNAAKVANIVSEAATSNFKLEIQDLLMKSTLDSIFQVAFGTELNSMCGSSEEGKNFANAFDTASALTLYRYVDVFWKIKKFLNIGSEAALRKNTEVLNEFVIKLINTRIQQMNSKGDSIRKSGDILSRFLQVKEYDTTYLRDIILNFVIAGKDTTAATLSWFMYMLCKYPAVQEKAAEEVREATNTKTVSSCTEFVSCVTDEALEKMNYLHATLTETLRLYPAVPVDAKICFADDTLPDGYSVKKGDMVSYQPYAMGRMKFIWGDDAEEFRPARWLDENGNFQAENPFKFTAFQAGPRICLGKEFAYRQMKIFSAVLLGCFRFKLNDEKRNVTYKTMINLHIDGGLEIKALHRD
ncbi:putative abieta-7,13-dien-18-ol hydroxylase [Medicago truncatula]|uniref:Cytochrome P450 family protein n=1 Tax=Medicago truncatula TaxID=3880 RepID=G7LDJ8_MEDTR|nr:cytochrome P450 704C1 [Medicago truncatula]AET02145.2 cytochrome P450 family protein [Medicago truncatula]RHN40128.1 putative abieta-7,13-dien-18-ol hydroxylase [Medicago truncatula]